MFEFSNFLFLGIHKAFHYFFLKHVNYFAESNFSNVKYALAHLYSNSKSLNTKFVIFTTKKIDSYFLESVFKRKTILFIVLLERQLNLK